MFIFICPRSCAFMTTMWGSYYNFGGFTFQIILTVASITAEKSYNFVTFVYCYSGKFVVN